MGGIYGWICMMPGLFMMGSLFGRLVSLSAISAICFGWNFGTLRRGAVFAVMTFALNGILPAAEGRNWLQILLCALLLWLLCSIGRESPGRECIPVELEWEEQVVRLLALRDTGNLLRDPLTGEQVLVAGADVAVELLGLTPHQILHPVETVSAGALQGLRLIPYQSIGQPGGLMLGLRLKNVKLGNRRLDPLVAFAPQKIAGEEGYRMLTGGNL